MKRNVIWVITLSTVVVMLTITVWVNYQTIKKTNEDITLQSTQLEKLQQNIEKIAKLLDDKMAFLSSSAVGVSDSIKKGERKKRRKPVATPKMKVDTVRIVDYRRDSLLMLQDSINILSKLMVAELGKHEVEKVKHAEMQLTHYIDSLHLKRIAAMKNGNYLFKAVNKNNINLVLLQSQMVDNYHYLIYAIENEGKTTFTPDIIFSLPAIKSSEAVQSILPDSKKICWVVFEGKNSSITLQNISLMLLVK